MTDHEIPILETSGQERQRDGAIVSLREQDTGRLDTVHVTGKTRDALEQLCDMIDQRDGDWKIVAISTPASIFRDLQGVRGQYQRASSKRRSTLDDPRTAEWSMLSQVGRLDLLQPLTNRELAPRRRKIA